MNNKFLLTIDIGNTDTTFGLFNDNKLIKKFRMKSDLNFFANNFDEFFNKNLKEVKVEDCILCSVNEKMNEVISNSIKIKYNILPVIFDYKMCKDMKVLTKNPETTGADRLANAYAARKIGHSAIIVDIGSAITFDILSKEGDFIGGIIMPGINMQLDALHNKTNKLPKIEIEDIKSTIGNSTKNAILSGVIRGTASAIDGLIEECKKELNDIPLLYVTGGQCELLPYYMKCKFNCINPNLTLEGLQKVWMTSQNQKY